MILSCRTSPRPVSTPSTLRIAAWACHYEIPNRGRTEETSGEIDRSDNALLMDGRMQQAGVNVQNATYDIGHKYTDEVYDLIMSIQP